MCLRIWYIYCRRFGNRYEGGRCVFTYDTFISDFTKDMKVEGVFAPKPLFANKLKLPPYCLLPHLFIAKTNFKATWQWSLYPETKNMPPSGCILSCLNWLKSTMKCLYIYWIGDENDDKRLAPSDFLLFTGAENFANLILSDLLTLIKLHDLHVQHSSLEFWGARNIY